MDKEIPSEFKLFFGYHLGGYLVIAIGIILFLQGFDYSNYYFLLGIIVILFGYYIRFKYKIKKAHYIRHRNNSS